MRVVIPQKFHQRSTPPPPLFFFLVCVRRSFWQGGVRGNAFVAGGLLPAAMRGSHWAGAAHAADWYTTIAAMAGASVANSGPLPVICAR